MMRTKSKKSEGVRVIFRVPDDLEDAFLALRRLGYGDTEITVECLRHVMPQVRKELVAARAAEVAKQAAELPALPSVKADPKTFQEALKKSHAERLARKRGKDPANSR